MATTRRKSGTSRKPSTSRSRTGRKSASAKRASSSRSHRGTKRAASHGGRPPARKKASARKYSKKASNKVGKVMHEFKHGQLRSGGRREVKSRKQAIAIGISEARREGDKVPKRRSSSRKAA
jgi:hypothetical protein